MLCSSYPDKDTLPLPHWFPQCLQGSLGKSYQIDRNQQGKLREESLKKTVYTHVIETIQCVVGMYTNVLIVSVNQG